MMRQGGLAGGVSLGAWLAFRSGYTGRVRTGLGDQARICLKALASEGGCYEVRSVHGD